MKTYFGSLVRRLGRTFLAGVLAVLPLVITVAVVAWVGDLAMRLFGPGTAVGRGLISLGLPLAGDATLAYAIGAAIVLASIFLLGVAVESGARSLWQRLVDGVIQRIPVIGSVYGTSKQLVSLADRRPDANLQGMKPVFCFFGSEGGVAILALLVSPERYRIDGRDYLIVIVPTAPVPVGGGLFFMPADMVQPADVSLEGVVSIYVSMGVTAPQFLPRAEGA